MQPNPAVNHLMGGDRGRPGSSPGVRKRLCTTGARHTIWSGVIMASSIEEAISRETSPGFEGALASIVERIREQEARRQKVAQALSGLRGLTLNGLECTTESCLVSQVKMDPLFDLKVAGVDGGLLEEQLHGLDLILVRVLAAIFHYRNGELELAEYLPNEMPLPKLIDIAEPLDAWEFELLAGMERQLAETELAASAVEKSSAKVLFLDGSVVPQYVERFPHSSLLLNRYQRLIKSYERLYQKCMELEVSLAGVVKDSRGNRFVDIIRHGLSSTFDGLGLGKGDLEILERSRDTALLDHLLEVGERTMAFTYAERPASYVLRDLGAWATRVYAFYLKTVPFDRPLRVEFVDFRDNPAETAANVASVIYALSSHHDAFGLPSVIIEADACARLAEEDLCIVRDSIADRIGPSIQFDLRRSRRPF